MSGRDEHDDDIQGPEDRVLESLLGGVIGGARPPDVSDAVLSRLQAARAAHLPGTHLPGNRARALARRSPALWLGALVGAAAAWLVWSSLALPGVTPARSDVPLHVVAGCLQWRTAEKTTDVSAPARVNFALAPFDRLAVCADSGATTDLADLGRLQMDHATELEIRTMEWKPFATGVALGAVTVAVIHGAITWTSGSDVARAAAGDSIELRGGSGSNPTLTALNQRVAELEQDLQNERKRYLALEAAAGRQRIVDEAAVAAAAEATPPPAEPLRHAVSYGGFESALAAIDWDITGEAMFKMSGHLDALMKAIEEGESPPLAAVAEIQQLNGELIKQAQALLDGDVPGTGVNGAFTHPVIAANQMFAALQKGGMPLDDQQRDGLQRLSAQLAGEDEARRSQLTGDETGLDALLGEMEIKDRFYADARRLLTPQQEQALYQAHTDGTTSSLFSSGIAWAQYGQPIKASDRGDYASQVADKLTRMGDFGEDVSPQLRSVVENWAKTIPEAAFAAGGKSGRMAQVAQPIAAVREAAKRQAELYREIIRTVPLTAAQKAKLRKAYGVFVPYGRD